MQSSRKLLVHLANLEMNVVRISPVVKAEVVAAIPITTLLVISVLRGFRLGTDVLPTTGTLMSDDATGKTTATQCFFSGV